MSFSKSKWFTYTLLVGLLPISTRLVVWAAAQAGKVNVITASDFVTLGLVLHISVINEVEHVSRKASSVKTILNGSSAFLIALYGALYAMAIIGEANRDFIDMGSMLKSSIALSSASLVLSIAATPHLAKRSTK